MTKYVGWFLILLGMIFFGLFSISALNETSENLRKVEQNLYEIDKILDDSHRAMDESLDKTEKYLDEIEKGIDEMNKETDELEQGVCDLLRRPENQHLQDDDSWFKETCGLKI